MKPSFRTVLLPAILGLALPFLLPLPLHAQTTNFPEAAEVNADFPDDAQRFAVFNILYDDFSRHAPKPLSSADYAKSFSYHALSPAS